MDNIAQPRNRNNVNEALTPCNSMETRVAIRNVREGTEVENNTMTMHLNQGGQEAEANLMTVQENQTAVNNEGSDNRERQSVDTNVAQRNKSWADQLEEEE